LHNFTNYKISDKNREEFDNLTPEDWDQFSKILDSEKVKKKDIIILRLYLSFIGSGHNDKDDPEFLQNLHF
jgi:hypothetical protein